MRSKQIGCRSRQRRKARRRLSNYGRWSKRGTGSDSQK